MSGFWNTTGLTGDELRAAIVAAKRQEDAVLAIYKAHGRALSPSDVWGIGTRAGRKWLLTSVRRAISNLSAGDAAPLWRTERSKTGMHGSRERLWALAA